jgi:WD40-like Beta Propeller Repeat
VAAVAVAAVLSSLAMAWQLYRTRETAPAGAAVRAVIALPDGMFLDGVGPPELAISRDGRTVAFLARGASGLQQLFVRAIDESLAAVVPNSETAEGPFFSPDGRWIAFAVGTSALAGGKPELRKYSLDTQLTQSVAPVLDYFG